MKMFEQQEKREEQHLEPVKVDSSTYIKANLMKSVDRSAEVYQEVEKWLYSFEGAITKDHFQHQLKRLDFNDSIAISQLQKAAGRRTIPLPPVPKKPSLTKPLLEQMLEDTYVAVTGKKFKQEIKGTLKQLRECGEVYVLQVEELILQFKDYEHKGSSPQMIDKAIECDFLVIVDLAMPIHIEWHIHEALNRILRKRKVKKKPIISTWHRFNDVNDFFESFKIYEVNISYSNA